MNILFPFYGDSIGGSHISTSIIIKNLKTPFNPIVVLHKEGVLSKYFESNNIPFKIDSRLKFYKTGLINYFLSLHLYYKFLKKNKIQIIHTNEIDMHLTWILPSLFSHIKHLWHQRTLGPNKSIYFSIFATKVLTVSNYCKNSFPDFFKKRIEVLYDPISDNIYNEINNNNFEAIRLGWVGNLKHIKRFDILIKTAKHLELLTEKEVLINVYGKMFEPLFQEYQNQIKEAKLDSSFQFHGFENDLNLVYKEIDFLIATSENDAFGRTLVEAFSYNKLVLANNFGGHTEIIDNNISGFLINNNDPIEYATKILSLIKNTYEYDRITKNAFLKFRNKFSIEEHLKNITKIYMKL
tara:strand:- start:357 stop:1412 length:1056 start_codon:yes stop_codon:yes gene_type:complete